MPTAQRVLIAMITTAVAVLGMASSATTALAVPSAGAGAHHDGPAGVGKTERTTGDEVGILAGRFDWWVEASFSKYSRQWTSTGVGYTNIKVNKVYDLSTGSPCSRMNFTLWRWNGVYWYSLGTKTANGCDGADDLIWHTSGGDYQFEANPTRGTGGPYVHAEGIVYYP
ncbi:hypothetical protein SAMN05216188_114127 [Lentzea xinjiangensis]|uniref:Uncharacterized protein n=2 Tax=Lentzea xinjiangensis TaxID=402600 RepID=A0A1H9RFY3_9PSEU|nr:hypothetical protein SAMN05216188_114127 [Lentzea xinjiangensis]